MERTISFRIWDKKNKCWLKYKKILVGWQYPQLSEPKGVYMNMWVLPDGSAFSELQHCLDRPESYSVQQFTGLTDKNGKNIFEGDILKLDDIFVPITYDDGAFQMVLNPEQGSSRAIQDRVRRFEVVGNIFKNPKLLK